MLDIRFVKLNWMTFDCHDNYICHWTVHFIAERERERISPIMWTCTTYDSSPHSLKDIRSFVLCSTPFDHFINVLSNKIYSTFTPQTPSSSYGHPLPFMYFWFIRFIDLMVMEFLSSNQSRMKPMNLYIRVAVVLIYWHGPAVNGEESSIHRRSVQMRTRDSIQQMRIFGWNRG